MGNNSVFDDIGLGASDLGLAKDPDEVAKDNAARISAEKSATAASEAQAASEASAREDKARIAGGRTKRVLSGGIEGEEDDGTSVSRRTLLGS